MWDFKFLLCSTTQLDRHSHQALGPYSPSHTQKRPEAQVVPLVKLDVLPHLNSLGVQLWIKDQVESGGHPEECILPPALVLMSTFHEHSGMQEPRSHLPLFTGPLGAFHGRMLAELSIREREW